ncbi:hypothetical protein [Acanthopleuribacter pedis]|uniref:Uncharacterized protein n=1 Tax=Acanthopleuribacter pedis TaxID=442870 RepID=A0A8J7U7Y5_9BACT|nr:hypothetical protein [Acanthopleuribacter pedis]MBO1323008.1 hypothetical protein [Acanthopleuribacter pedis]
MKGVVAGQRSHKSKNVIEAEPRGAVLLVVLSPRAGTWAKSQAPLIGKAILHTATGLNPRSKREKEPDIIPEGKENPSGEKDEVWYPSRKSTDGKTFSQLAKGVKNPTLTGLA